MKRLIIFIGLCFLISGCNDTTINFKAEVDNYVYSNNYTVIQRDSNTKDEVMLFESENEIGIIYFSIQKNILTTEINSTQKEVEKNVELLHIGNDLETYFSVVILDEELFNKSAMAKITFIDPNIEPLEISLGNDYVKIWMNDLDMSITSCAAQKLELMDESGNVVYLEEFIPT
ncbi:hypothetical protein RJG79_07630 [Mycoplasmatota bacterium WC44]